MTSSALSTGSALRGIWLPHALLAGYVMHAVVSDVSEWLAHVKAVSRHNCCRPQLQVVRLQDEFALPANLIYSPQQTLILRCPQTSSTCCAVDAVCIATDHSCIFRPFSVCSLHYSNKCAKSNLGRGPRRGDAAMSHMGRAVASMRSRNAVGQCGVAFIHEYG